MRDQIEVEWAAVKRRRKREKAPEELKPYFELLNTAKLHQEDVEAAHEILADALEYDDGLPFRLRKHLREYLDRPFDPEQQMEYDTLPQRQVTTKVDVKWVEPEAEPNEVSELFPNGLGNRKNYDQWKPPRKVEITKKMIKAKVVSKYVRN